MSSALRFLLFALCVCPLSAADLVELQAISDDILMLRFSEARPEPNDMGPPPTRFARNPLDVERAVNPAVYITHEALAGRMQLPSNPVAVGRKSKAMHFSHLQADHPHALDHWIYLKLHDPMTPGSRYVVSMNELADNVESLPFLFTPENGRTEAIHVNQVGYASESGMKFAYLYHWAGDLGPIDYSKYEGQPFHVVRHSDGGVVFIGSIAFRGEAGPETGSDGENPVGYYGANVWECDFSEFRPEGSEEYRIVVPNLGCSFPFVVGPDAYREAFTTTLRGLYHHRSGPARGLPWSVVEKPADHIPGQDGFVVYRSDVRRMDMRELAAADPEVKGRQNAGFVYLKRHVDRSQPVPEAWGGYFDAGDYDRHAGHLNINYYLLLAYDLAAANFVDGEANIPESGNGIPDIIDEACWNIDFFKRIQDPAGGIPGWLETERHPYHPDASWNDRLKEWYLSAPEPSASFKFAGCAAYLAYLLDRDSLVEEAVVNEYLAAAVRAYDWAQNPANRKEDDLSTNRGEVRSYRAFAAAALYRITGESRYQEQFKADHPVESEGSSLEAEDGSFEWAVWTYALTWRKGMDESLRERLRRASIRWARVQNAEPAARRNCRIAFPWQAPTVVGIGSTTPLCFPLMVGAALTEEADEYQLFRDYVRTTADYFLGGNPLNKVWVTTLGDRPVQAILNHDLWYDGDPSEFPGIVPYGFTAPRFDSHGSVWSPGYGKTTCYPNDDEGTATNWPIHELHFENRYPPMTAEYTVWQNIGPAAAVYGYLCGEARGVQPQ